MVTTGLGASLARMRTVRSPDTSKVIVSTDWEVAAEWTVDPPGSKTDWHVSTSIDIDGDPSVTGSARLRTSQGVTSAVLPLTVPLFRAIVDWTAIPFTQSRVYLEVKRDTGSGGLRVLQAAGVAMSYPPGYVPPPPTPVVTPAEYRGGWASEDKNTSFTILPSDIEPPPVAGDKVLLMGSARGPSELATFSFTFPGTELFSASGGTFTPRVIGTVVDYAGGTAGWTVQGSDNFQAAAIAVKNTSALTAGTVVQGFTPLDPPSVANPADSLGLVFTSLNFTQATVTGPSTGHTTVLDSLTGPRMRHVAIIDLPTAGTYDPDAAQTGPGSADASAVAIVAKPVAESIPAPTVPTFDTGGAITLGTLTADIAAAVAAEAPGTHFKLISGTYTNWNDVRPKQGMYFQGPDAGTAVLEGGGTLPYCFRALAHDGTGDDVVISQNITIQNYGTGTSRFDYGAIQGTPNDTVGNVWTYGAANNWFIHDVELDGNSANGITMGDNFTVYLCTAYGHSVTGIMSNRTVGGLIHTCTLEANGFDPATGIYSNGANMKFTWVNAAEGRTEVLPVGAQRTENQMIVANSTFNATKVGITGTSRHGVWFDLDCRNFLIIDCNMNNHVNSGIFMEGCNNAKACNNTVDNSDGFGVALGDDFISGGITVAESTNCLIDGNTISNCTRAIIHRQSNRSVDWYNPNGATWVNYAWPTGTRYWITAGTPLPVPSASDRSNMWTGNNTFQNNILSNCDRVYISEGTNAGGMTTQGSTPLDTIRFLANDYTGSATILFYDRSTTGINLSTWRSLPYDRDQV